MNRNTLIGFGLLFILLLLYQFLTAPSAEQLEQARKQQDSLITAQAESLRKDSLLRAKQQEQQASFAKIEADTSLSQAQKDSILQNIGGSEIQGIFGDFSAASLGQEQFYTLENEKLAVKFSNRGARIVSAQIKGFEGYNHATEDRYDKQPIELLSHPANRFEWLIPHTKASRGAVSTADLFFEAKQEGNTLVFRAYASQDRSRYVEERYTLDADAYTLQYDLHFENLRDLMPASVAEIPLNWQTNLQKIEKNSQYESTVSTVHYKEKEDSPSYCNCAASDQVSVEAPLQWVSHEQQFFNSTLIAKGNTAFKKGELATVMTPEAAYLKELSSQLSLPFDNQASSTYNFTWYFGPNDYNELAKLNVDLERIIPFGWSIFGTIGRYIIRPIFNVLAGFIGSHGIIILILTLIIKLMTYPLQHKMALSSVKMSLLKPELEKLRTKYKDDAQGMQMEQLKMYNLYGVNPLGGCLPMVLTMPIWISLYRFFPASIEFRQKPFLWAEDLASYDSIMDLSFNIPFYGDHVSLFTALWAISMVAYLYYNSKQMDMSAAAGGDQAMNMKMMKVMQYAFPFIFFFALNSWAAGLTAYMLFSNLINIIQTYVTKNILINKDKVWAQMQEIKKNPPKASFMEQAMRQQQEELRKRNNP